MDANGKPAGVLGTHLSWEWARDIERSIIAPVQSRNRVQALIVSAEGVVLLGPECLHDTKVYLAILVQARQGRTGRPRSWKSALATCLSMPTAEPSTPAPTHGTPASSRRP